MTSAWRADQQSLMVSESLQIAYAPGRPMLLAGLLYGYISASR